MSDTTRRPGGDSILGRHLPGTGGDVAPAALDEDVEGHLYTGGPTTKGEVWRRGGPEEVARRITPDDVARRDDPDGFVRRAPGEGPHGEG